MKYTQIMKELAEMMNEPLRRLFFSFSFVSVSFKKFWIIYNVPEAWRMASVAFIFRKI